jgi:glycosyltransferase involved in cell wall biosynthesis
MEFIPKISVVMSVYNSADFLKEAIDSILNQTFSDFEFIIINDGSTDNSLNIIKSYNDKRIKLIDNVVNKGLIYSLNKGFDEAIGKYIARMDADDISELDRLKKQFDFLELNENIGVLGGDYISFSNKHSKRLHSIVNSNEIKTFLLFSATMCHPTLMIRKNILVDNQFKYSETAKHVEDYDLWTKLVLKTDFENLPDVLLKYRDHVNQVSHANNDTQLKNSNTIRENYLKCLGFQFTEKELAIHNLISSNKRIVSKEELLSIETWLLNLIHQNSKLRVIIPEAFNKVISKMWADSCGNTKLGLLAYIIFMKSKLKINYKYSTRFYLKLVVKSLVRWVR